jgi:putative membrane protein
MAQPEPVTEPGSPAHKAAQVDVWQRTSMAAERTWLAWWRTALTATAGALAVGRFAPELLDVAPGPYVALGCGYAALALGLLVFGALRQRQLERSIVDGVHSPLPFGLVAAFTIGGVLLVTFTVVLVGAQI